ncbi:hypothetical protein F2Q68_00035443 [Brassica cretica]|uniref:Expansin n=1 Tax=Brassica cretica TaxID=69181 RepID=A0A8S9HDL2_BRACR|nr:hypothetical protein F2Q68_00035443 [Brassica cretica]
MRSNRTTRSEDDETEIEERSDEANHVPGTNGESELYQYPIPIELVKPFVEIDYEGRDGSPRGRARRGRGRGRGRGGRGDGYVNAEYDDGSMEPERVPGRGGRGGRGRGGFSGPPPYYEAQQDGGDYGRNGPPPQHHGYDDGGMEPERPSGRGRGGGRRGGRGRGGFNGPPRYYEAQQDGGNYGHSGGPPQDHEYDDGGMEPERPSGRGRGGGRRGTRGGRGRGGFNGPPQYYEAEHDGGDYGYGAPHQGRGEVVEGEEAVVDSTDQVDHRFRQLLRITCDYAADSRWCKKGASVVITATNFCPPNFALPNNDGGWCNPPLKHFDMAQPAWEKIGIYRGGIVPVVFQRVSCYKRGGVRFRINGRDYFELVNISNVGGAGSIQSVSIKGSKTGWLAMSRNWGANWQSNAYLDGQSLSFSITTTDGATRVFLNVVPSSWSFGQTYSSRVQF